jgi:hypothetical protein
LPYISTAATGGTFVVGGGQVAELTYNPCTPLDGDTCPTDASNDSGLSVVNASCSEYFLRVEARLYLAPPAEADAGADTGSQTGADARADR